ncbi:MAG: hypothetical protein D6796_08560 [Caldilineae bacterium]|nr:MAG: hypothetical protein D6796_08560 [Caldilineae bacterium]
MRRFSRLEYERLLYNLPQSYPEIKSSSLHLFTTSKFSGLVKGSVWFHNGLELRIQEVIDFSNGEILDYSYTLFYNEERIRWYDPQPHPENPELASTFPHHFHEHPDIKHNRKPAPGITFQIPNLPTLIADCITLGKSLAT